MSWRDGVSEDAQGELDALFSVAMSTAKSHLDEFGEYFPFGNCIKIGADRVTFNNVDMREEHPKSTDVISELKIQYKQQMHKLSSISITYTATLSDGSDAVVIECEHREGIAIQIFVSYKFKGFGKKKKVEFFMQSVGTAVIKPFIWN